MITPVGSVHAALLAALHGRCFAEAWDEKAMADLLAMPGAFGFLAADADPMGFVLVAETGEEAEILTLAVEPAARRRGLARALMAAVVDELEARGVTRLLLEVAADNQAARALYEGLGLREVGRRPGYYRRGCDAVDALLLAAAVQDLRISSR